MPAEKYDKRFGMIAAEKGFITYEQLLEAMKIQIFENLVGNKHRLIGEVLLEKEYITTSQVDEVHNFLGVS